jgi:signal transduction histidine kinase
MRGIHVEERRDSLVTDGVMDEQGGHAWSTTAMDGRGRARCGDLDRGLESSHDSLRQLVEEQAALRRVATLVARAAPPAELFEAVCGEVARLLEAPSTKLFQYGSNGTASVVAESGEVASLGVGHCLPVTGNNLLSVVWRTRRPYQIEADEDDGPTRDLARRLGVRSAVGAPIVVEGRLWGMMSALWTEPGQLPPGIEVRLAQFTDLVATAIANADSRAELAASRARVVAAADDTRRRIERDLHDGTQQRLVSLALDLRSVEAAVPSELIDLKAQLSRTVEGLAGAIDELREISRGLHPAILSKGGLGPTLKGLARRCPVPVSLRISADRRLPERVEVAVYYLVSEALTNVAKHAQASSVEIELEAAESVVRVAVIDDGVGGAHPQRGSGLIGLRDRIQALGGSFQVNSPERGGTQLVIEIPLTQP